MLNFHLVCSQPVKDKLQPLLEQTAFSFPDLENLMIIEMTKDIRLSDYQAGSSNLIFIIENGQSILDILSLKPLAVWRKTFLEEDMKQLDKLLYQRKMEHSHLLTFQSGGNSLSINIYQILYIEASLHYIFIHTPSSVFKVRNKISDALIQLQNNGFIQIHRSFLVNQIYIIALTDTECILVHDIHLPLGKKYQKKLLAYLQKRS